MQEPIITLGATSNQPLRAQRWRQIYLLLITVSLSSVIVLWAFVATPAADPNYDPTIIPQPVSAQQPALRLPLEPDLWQRDIWVAFAAPVRAQPPPPRAKPVFRGELAAILTQNDTLTALIKMPQGNSLFLGVNEHRAGVKVLAIQANQVTILFEDHEFSLALP